MTDDLKLRLRQLADKYEKAAFCEQDPSQFLRWYQPENGKGSFADVEAASFIAAMLAFGNRKQFIPKIKQILETSDRSLGCISKWLRSGAYKKDFPCGQSKFYRFYSYDDMQIFFDELADILNSADSLGDFFHEQYCKGGVTGATPVREGSDQRSGRAGRDFSLLAEIIAQAFPKSAIVPKGKASANKRVHMFLRWMVRRDSQVDLGLWQWANPAELIIPLDVHVMQEAARMGLISEKATASRKTAELLTSALNEVFPGDPCRGDFALFGLGVDESEERGH